MTLFSLHNRTAVVTGAAQGMGRAMATALAEAGADLVLLDRNAPGIEATAPAITQLGRKALPIPGDVTNTDPLDQVFVPIDRAFGRVDILGNVAGEAKSGPAEDRTRPDIRATFHNLVIRRTHTCQLAGRRMLARGKGCIISIRSPAGPPRATAGFSFPRSRSITAAHERTLRCRQTARCGKW